MATVTLGLTVAGGYQLRGEPTDVFGAIGGFLVAPASMDFSNSQFVDQLSTRRSVTFWSDSVWFPTAPGGPHHRRRGLARHGGRGHVRKRARRAAGAPWGVVGPGRERVRPCAHGRSGRLRRRRLHRPHAVLRGQVPEYKYRAAADSGYCYRRPDGGSHDGRSHDGGSHDGGSHDAVAHDVPDHDVPDHGRPDRRAGELRSERRAVRAGEKTK
eukprot:1185534-Prorocentrum_minimum.AAC.2